MARGLIIAPGLDEFISEFTLSETKPDCVAFLATEATLQNVTKMASQFKSKHKVLFIKDIFSTSETISEFMKAFSWMRENKVDQLSIDATNCITIIEMATYISASLLNVYEDLLGDSIDFKLIYVHCDYEEKEGGVFGEIRGSERIVELEKPLDSLGFVLALDAARAFNRDRHAHAQENFKTLEKNATGERSVFYKGLYYLSKGYGSWDRLQFEDALESLKESREYLKKVITQVGKELMNKIESNIKVVEKLIGEDKVRTVLDVYANANRREKEGTYDDAIARLYACLERIVQYRLSKHEIDSSKPNYSKLDPKIAEKVGNAEELELKKGATILIELNDPIGKIINKLTFVRFKRLLSIRNNSILAHGISPVSKKNLKDFKYKLLEPCFEEFCKIEGIKESDKESHVFPMLNEIHKLYLK